MKKILVPTDFSEISENATNYAIELARFINAQVILFHVYQIPLVNADVIMMMPAIDEFEEEAKENMERLVNKIHINYGDNVVIKYKVTAGFVIDGVRDFAKENNIDLIVMGMHGGGYLTEKLIGSVTTSLLREADCSVLAIDQKVKFKPLDKIVLACDCKHINTSILSPLKEIAKPFNAHINILNVVSSTETIPENMERAMSGLNLDDAFSNVPHSFHYCTNDDVVNGINDYVAKSQINMVVMIPRKHSTIKKLFNEPNTKRLAFHTNVPLLALHE